MLLKDFIAETRGEQRELWALARGLLKVHGRKQGREYSLSDLGHWAEPAVQALAAEVRVKFDSRYDRSMYNPRTKEVLIKDRESVDLASELAHELQHALDDVKSQGRFRRERGSYLTRQSEVNARLTQAVGDIEQALGKVRASGKDWQDPKLRSSVNRLIASYLKKHQLTPQQGIDQDRYQRLVARIYNYLIN